MLGDRIAATGIPAIYANLVGGQDELVFDGAAFSLDEEGNVDGPGQFAEAIGIVDVESAACVPTTWPGKCRVAGEVYDALVLGTAIISSRTILGVMIGLSGGIDSALTRLSR